MNTNISNAALAATLYADSYDDLGSHIWFQKYNEKFAQLVVELCAEKVRGVLRSENSDLSYTAADQVQRAIKELLND